MPVACLYDIHGNLAALEAVLAEPDVVSAQRLVIGGDAVAGPSPAELLELLAGLGSRAVFIRGNGDRELDAWVAERLSPEQRAIVQGWPEGASLEVPGLGAVRFCHGSPRSDTEIITAASPLERLEPMLRGVTEATLVCGHTHVQFDRTVAGCRIVNAGSVGMTYQGEAGAAFWCLLGPGVQLRRTAYDGGLFAGVLARSGFPNPDWFEPATAEQATQHFEAMA